MTDHVQSFATRFPGAIILPYNGVWPTIAESAFIAPTAVVIGNVTVGEEASIWFHTVVRGDIAPISIGARSNVQDLTMVHVNGDAPVEIGDDVTIGHSAIIHGTTIGNHTLIGMGAIIMSYTTIGAEVTVAAGALVSERTVIEDGSVWVGLPAKQRGHLDEHQREHLAAIPGRYVGVSRQYLLEQREKDS